MHEIREGDRPKISRSSRGTCFRSHSAPASVRRIALAQNSARKTIARKSDAQNRAARCDCRFSQKVGAVDLNRPPRLMNKMNSRLRVTVWNENVHEQKNPAVAKIYPNGIHGC